MLMTFMSGGISSWNSTSGSSFRPSTCDTMDSVRNDGVAGGRGHERRADRAYARTSATISIREALWPSLVMDGAMKPMTISGTQKGDDLAEHLLYGDNDIHDRLVRHETEQITDDHAKQQLERQTFKIFPIMFTTPLFTSQFFLRYTIYDTVFILFVNTFRRLSRFPTIPQKPSRFRLCPRAAARVK